MKRNIVIIDDRETQRMILKKFLIIAGHEVIGEGANGKEAITLAKKLNPDLVILDVKMPVMGGIEAAREISASCPLPIILYTAKNDQETIDGAKEAGVMAYLVKPLRDEDINPTIELAISRFQESQSLRQENLNLRETLAARKVAEKAKGLLMEKEGLSEREAFQKIQKASMDKRLPLSKVADAIIISYEIRGKK